MIPIPIALLVAILLVGFCTAVCLLFRLEIDRLQRQNAALRRTLGNMVRMEKLNSHAVYALMREVNQLPRNRRRWFHNP